MENNASYFSGITLQVIKCPSCAGELSMPDPCDVIKCSYCGSNVIVKEAFQAKKNGSIERVNDSGASYDVFVKTAKLLISGLLLIAALIFFYAPRSDNKHVINKPVAQPVITVSLPRHDAGIFQENITLAPGLYEDEALENDISGEWYYKSDIMISIVRNGELFEVKCRNQGNWWKGYGQLWNKKMFVMYYRTNAAELAYVTFDFKIRGYLFATSVDSSGRTMWSGQFEKSWKRHDTADNTGIFAEAAIMKQGFYEYAGQENKITGAWYHRTEGCDRIKLSIRRNGGIFELMSDNLTNQWKGVGQLMGNKMYVMFYYTNLSEAAYITLDFVVGHGMRAAAIDPDGKVRWSGVFER